ncbi:hypothetical protein, partial [Desulfomarina sp.]
MLIYVPDAFRVCSICSMSVSAGLKTTLFISLLSSQPLVTLMIPGCPSRAALPTSYHATTN